MKLTRIEVKNYRSLFADATEDAFRLDLADGMNSIVGPNNVGKSNLLRAVALALDASFPFQRSVDMPGSFPHAVPRVTLEFESQGRSSVEQTLLRRAAEYERSSVGGTRKTYADDGIVRFTVSHPGNRRVGSARQESIGIRGAGARQGDQLLLDKTLGQFRKTVHFVIVRSGESLESLLSGKFREILHTVLQQHVRQALDRAQELRDGYVTGLQNEVLAPMRQQMEGILGNLFEEITGVNLEPDVRAIEDTLSNVDVSLRDAVETTLAAKGTGIRAGVMVAMLRYLAENTRRSIVFAVEEPEAFLHPAAQETLRDDLEALAVRNDVTLLVTTHSPFIPSRDAEAQIIALTKDGAGRTAVEGIATGDEPYASLLGGLFRDAALSDIIEQSTRIPPWARGVLLVEGTTDEDYLRIAAKKADRTGLLSGLHIVPTGGASKALLEAVLTRSRTTLPTVVLLDSDTAGRAVVDRLIQFGFDKRRDIVSYRDLFVGKPEDVEAEDLFPPRLLQSFVDHHGEDTVLSGKRKHPVLKRWQYDLNAVGKDRIPQYLHEHATSADCQEWVQLLEEIRSRMNLTERDGFVPLDSEEARRISDPSTLSPWCDNPHDLERAVWVLSTLTDKLRGVVAAFARHPDGATGDEVANEAGYPLGARGVAPALGHLALRCKQAHRQTMWAVDNENGPRRYTMPADAAKVFAKALDQVDAGWRR